MKSGSAGFSNTTAARQRSEKRRVIEDWVLPGRITLPAVDGCRCEAGAGFAVVLVASCCRRGQCRGTTPFTLRSDSFG